MRNPYILAGIVLLIVGLYFSSFSYFVLDSIPFTAVGISTVIIGFTSIGLANTRPKMSPEACQIILKTGVDNTTEILEGLNIKNKAIYLPQNKQGASPQALIPLNGEMDIQRLKAISPRILLNACGLSSHGTAISVTTPGNLCLKLLKNKPGASANEIKAATNYVLTRVLDIASGVNVSFSDRQVKVEVDGAEISHEDNLFYRCLGSPIASIAAAICSEALNRPVQIVEESNGNRKTRIVLEVLS
jgi:hypothetical protein